MKLLITKASDINYIDISDIYDISTLYQRYGRFVIEENSWKNYKIEAIIRCWNVSIEKAKQISNCDFRLIIYDDYIE